MTIVSSGTISINSLVGEYGGSAPHAMNEYYKGGSYVLNHSNNANVPTSGVIDLQDFYGANNTNPAPTTHSHSMSSAQGALPITNGFDSFGTPTFGSLSNTPNSAGAFASGWNPTIKAFYSVNVKGVTVSFVIDGANQGNSGWTSIDVPASLIQNTSSAVNLTRSSATYNGTHSVNYTSWSWTTFEFQASTTGTVVVNA